MEQRWDEKDRDLNEPFGMINLLNCRQIFIIVYALVIKCCHAILSTCTGANGVYAREQRMAFSLSDAFVDIIVKAFFEKVYKNTKTLDYGLLLIGERNLFFQVRFKHTGIIIYSFFLIIRFCCG